MYKTGRREEEEEEEDGQTAFNLGITDFAFARPTTPSPLGISSSLSLSLSHYLPHKTLNHSVWLTLHARPLLRLGALPSVLL